MNRRAFQDDTPPWSFFLPVTLAVVVGVLVADAVRLAIGAVFVREAVESTAAGTPAKAPPAAGSPGAGERIEPAPATPAAPTQAAADSDIPALPGPLSAMRDSADRACINDTVAERRPNGWEQALEDDAPVRCTAASP